MPNEIPGSATEEQQRSHRLSQALEKITKAGQTQRQVALELNVPPQYLSDLKNGHRNVTEPFALRFADVYRVSSVWLLHGEGPRELPGDVERTVPTSPGIVSLPVLPWPIAGEPRESPAWDGSTAAVAGAAAALAQRAERPYLLRVAQDDPQGRFRKHDLLLCDQKVTGPREAGIVTAQVKNRLHLARRNARGRLASLAGKSIQGAEVTGHCLGIVWGPLS